VDGLHPGETFGQEAACLYVEHVGADVDHAEHFALTLRGQETAEDSEEFSGDGLVADHHFLAVLLLQRARLELLDCD